MARKRRGLGRVPHPDTPRAAALHPVTAHPRYRVSTRTSRFWYQGGAWLDQGQTGTCVGNAFAHRLADSPIVEHGIDEAFARELYVAASGDATLQEGTSGLAAARVLLARRTISGFLWPPTPDEFWNALLELGSLAVGTLWLEDMFEPEVGRGGYRWLNPSGKVAGGHEYLINGGNRTPASGPPWFRMKNSWGRAWADQGTARIAADDLFGLIYDRDGDACLIAEVGGL